MGSSSAIGIDLGTSFSAAAVYRNGKTEIIPNKEGNRLTPSFVFYNPRSLDVSVGTTADDMGVKEITNFLFDLKRIIGRKYHDVYIQELNKSAEYKFKIVCGEKEAAEIELLHDNVMVHKSPEAACSEILRYLRESANEYLEAEVTEAVISIPAHFSNAQRKATRASAELAGLKVLKLITEPVAGAIHYAEDRLTTNGTLLVFDFGGGTLDVSIIEVDKTSFKVKSVEGDTFLGGRNFDQILLQYFKTDIIRIFGANIFTDRMLRRVKNACTRLKIKLSTHNEYCLTINCIGGQEENEYALRMSRSEFEHLTEDLFNKAIYLVEKCIKEAGLTKSDIDEVILVGGTTRIPKIRNILNAYFNEKIIKTGINPDEAIALGAAVQAAMIKEKFKDLEKYKVTEVAPLSLGMETGFLMRVFIKKNTPIPFKSQPLINVTVHNNQRRILGKVFEGERKNCKFNNLLGTFTLEDLPAGRAGAVTMETIFTLSEDGILEVEAYEPSNKKKTKIAVTIGEYRLCDNKIKNAIEDAERNKMEDKRFEKFACFKRKVFKKCNDILYDLNNIPLIVDRKFVKKKCKALLKYCTEIEYTQIDKLQEKYIAFGKVIKEIIDTYIDVELNDGLVATQTSFDVETALVSVENKNATSN